ncbi:MAG: glycosyl hydrolase [Clostridiales bacterium]|nr:glycosyl hydrolase [Clostridiales bacterium]
MATDLKAMPFYLDDEAIQWVEETIKSMSLEEKIGQLFINLGLRTDESYIRNLVENYHIGGARFTETDGEKIFAQNQCYQKYSKIPLLIAVNCETGGNGACRQGTFVATEAQCEASADTQSAYQMGRISGKEAAAIGCNCNFSPMADIVLNWRNTIVNTRSFGRDPETVLAMCKEYIRGAKESGILSCVKHFPGDGIEERDQHLVMGINDLTCEEWDNSFGKVYSGLIQSGLEAVMVGHIALPSYSRKYRPDITPEEIMPATLAPELINGLLREKLGFQGLVITDASHMGGLLSAKPRMEQVPGAIAAGCDMFLFFHDMEEDFQYMLQGYKDGIITEERLNDALMHILGMKAHIGLHKKRMPDRYDEKQVLGCREHHEAARKIADKSITLVKDTQKLLPIDVEEKKRAKLYFLETAPVSYTNGTDPTKYLVKEELERAGFTVDMNESYYEMEAKEPSAFNRFRVMEMPKVEDFKAKYDVIFVFVHMKGYAQESNVRVKFSAAHSNELPWWTHEVPTVCVSLNYTNHLYDLPMMRTFINAYAPTRECIRATVEKIVGKSEFTGVYNENVWCGQWDTRL